ncbi:MAG: ABC transporter substrate-binding protein [Defluviitaleaceae bacterium]|nr:ABC transporter substrate-binding protein [Defluviitaleaceae bacterium]
MKKIKKTLVVTIFATFLLALLAACSSSGSVENTQATRMFIDREGNEVEVPTNIETIISLAPSVTETLVNLGLGDRIIAIDMNSEDVAGVPSGIPTFNMMAPDIESLVALNPDLIFSSSINRVGGEDPFSQVFDAGIAITAIPTSASIESIKEDIRFIGLVTNTETRAEEIVANFEREIEEILQIVDGAGQGITVYFEISPHPWLFSFGSGVFLNELIEMLGATNILNDQEEWIPVSEEIIIERNPDIIFTNVSYIDNAVEEILSRDAWGILSAVENGNVHLVSVNTSSRSNENVVVALREMAMAMFPERF